jgi:hypothetical protein
MTGLVGGEAVYRDPGAMESDLEALDGIVPFPEPKAAFPDILAEQTGEDGQDGEDGGEERELIDLAGLTSARDGLVQYVSEVDTQMGFMTVPRIVHSWRIDLSRPLSPLPGVRTALPPERHLVRPSGEQLVGGTLLWIDDILNPLHFTQTDHGGIQFRVSPEGGHSPSPFEFSFLTSGDESMTSRYSDIIMRWLSMMSPSNQMFSAVPALKNRSQTLYVYDVFERTLKRVDVRVLLGEGIWRAPWILPMGSDNWGNLIVKIVDSDRDPLSDGIRLIQRTFDMDRGRVKWSINMEKAVSTTPWDSHLFNDHCCGYVAKEERLRATLPVLAGGNTDDADDGNNFQLYGKIYDLEYGKLISTIGPLPRFLSPLTPRHQSILTSFLYIFQDRSSAFNPLPPAGGSSNPCPLYFYKITSGELLYTIQPPSSALFESPRSWIHRGEDALERYVLLNGVGQREDVNGVGWPEGLDGSKKWLVLDTVRREWFYGTSTFERWRFSNQGMHVLYRVKKKKQGATRGEGGGTAAEEDQGVRGLRLVYARINIPVQ